MNKKMIMLMFFFFIMPMYAIADMPYMPNKMMKKSYKTQRKASLLRLCSSYIVSLGLSAGVGFGTGTAVRYLEEKLDIESSPFMLVLGLFIWMIEYELRNDIIDNLQQYLDSYHIKHKKVLMFRTAWLTSWLVYLNENDKFLKRQYL